MSEDIKAILWMLTELAFVVVVNAIVWLWLAPIYIRWAVQS